MTRLKLGLLALFVSLFAFACATNTNTGTAVGNQNRTVTNNTANGSAAAANANGAATNDALAAARTTYNNACVKCHKDNGEGGTVDVDGEKVRVPSFKGAHAHKDTDADYFKQIADGGEGMPKFKGRLTEEQINGLVRFIRAEFQAGMNIPGAANANK
jgi:cytochrome c551